MNDVRRRAQPWLGTIVSIELRDPAPCATEAACAAAFAAVARVHGAMSVQMPASDIARFNAAPAGATIICDPWTVRVLRLAARLKQTSEGLFDIALGSGAAYWVLDARRVVKVTPAARLDVGGIAKGFAVDRAVAALRAHGIRRGLVNAGGDLRAFGAGAWKVAIRGGAVVLSIERAALATSQYRRGHSPYHDDALIEPATARVHAIDRTITVAAPRCVWADAMTKIVALSGDVRSLLLQRAGARAWLQ